MERDELRTTLVNHLETLRRNLQAVYRQSERMVGSMTGKTNDHTASKNAATIHKEDAK